jgi:phosphoribosylformimino-5-aminoimidazole carboxamide ribotide isomerase
MFSLDLRHGEPLGDRRAWNHDDAAAIARRVSGLGVRRLLVLDLARIGTRSGPAQVDLLTAIARAHPDLELWTGGGIRDQEDIDRLARVGVQGVLLGSILHDGRFTIPMGN